MSGRTKDELVKHGCTSATGRKNRRELALKKTEGYERLREYSTEKGREAKGKKEEETSQKNISLSKNKKKDKKVQEKIGWTEHVGSLTVLVRRLINQELGGG